MQIQKIYILFAVNTSTIYSSTRHPRHPSPSTLPNTHSHTQTQTLAQTQHRPAPRGASKSFRIQFLVTPPWPPLNPTTHCRTVNSERISAFSLVMEPGWAGSAGPQTRVGTGTHRRSPCSTRRSCRWTSSPPPLLQRHPPP